VEIPNKMDYKPFFVFSMEAIKPTDVKTLENFQKSTFDIDKIVKEAGNLKLQSSLRKELEAEFANPSDEFVKIMAKRVYTGNITSAIKENVSRLLVATISTLVRDMVTDRLSSALNASAPKAPQDADEIELVEDDIITTEEEVAGFRIVQAIASRLIDPKRVVIRDKKSYCGVLLDNNNRKPIVRLRFNSESSKYVGTFISKDETLNGVSDVTDLYKYASQIEGRIQELEGLAAVK
jgi:hypothetical protein